jgi:hypothetical protein
MANKTNEGLTTLLLMTGYSAFKVMNETGAAIVGGFADALTPEANFGTTTFVVTGPLRWAGADYLVDCLLHNNSLKIANHAVTAGIAPYAMIVKLGVKVALSPYAPQIYQTLEQVIQHIR